MSSNSVSGVKGVLTPLIDFYTIIDIDVGLVRLIYNEYNDPSVFDNGFFEKDMNNIISEIYYRSEFNPLYLLSNSSDKEKLDKYYSEFCTLKKKEIYWQSVSTEIANLIQVFITTNEIVPEILYYDDDQLEILESIESLNGVKKVKLSSLSRLEKDKYKQFYFRCIEDAKPFSDLEYKTFYFSTYGLNMNDKFDDFRSDKLLDDLLLNKNQIAKFSLYNESIIRKENN